MRLSRYCRISTAIVLQVMSNGTTSFRIFKGLQKPLEFMGLKGRYVWIGLGAVVATIIAFIIIFIAAGFLPALITGLGIPVAVIIWIRQRSKRGLHSKRSDKGVYIVTQLISW